VGKSALSLELGKKLKISQIVDVDVVREAIRGFSSKNDQPYLYYNSTTAWEHVNDDSEMSVICSFIKYCESILLSIIRIIERAYVLGKDTIIEGVQIIPSFFEEYLKKKNFHLIMVGCSEKNHLLNIARRKKEFGGINPKRFYERFPKARIIQDYLLQDAKTNNVPCVVNCDLVKTRNQILKLLVKGK